MMLKPDRQGVPMFRSHAKSYVLLPLLTLATAALLWLGQSTVAADKAEACRDCPFPMRISDGHWLMPNGMAEIFVNELNLGGGRIQTVVRLFDAKTGDLLAVGSLDHNKGRKRLKVELIDFAGGSITVDLQYANLNRTKIKVKMTCQQCNVQPSYWN